MMPTPLVVAKKGGASHTFYRTCDFDEWAIRNKGFTVNYYKGLGSWSSAGAREIFRVGKPVSFVDSPDADDSIMLGFSKSRVESRKRWIEAATAQPPTALAYNNNVTIGDFINRDLVFYSVYSVHRALPSVCDGFRICSRKIIFTCFLKNLTSSAKKLKVAQLAASTAAETVYLHGEASLNDAVITLAQSFAGKNNCPLLEEDGFFGSRLQVGDVP